MRYLFAFLNYFSESSDINLMDPSNLSTCFGPTLLQVPDSVDQVYYQNFMNEVVKNLIIHHAKIFSPTVPGPIFQRPTAAER
jgi:SLIT-ROBO Rho GTPase activating protein